MRILARLGALATALLLPATAFAASSPFGIATPDGSGSVAWAGPFKGFFLWVAAQQAIFYRELTHALSQLSESGHAAWFLVALSFAYGIFHAVGPGHGKAVIASYLLATGDKLKRGVVISFASAFVQALTAILVVSIGTMILNVTAVTMTRATDALEIASYSLIVLCGAWLLWTKAVGGGHSHAAAEPILATPAATPQVSEPVVLGLFSHRHDENCIHNRSPQQAGFACDCGHSHAPDPASLEQPLTLGRAWAAVLAVGVRPCSGAVIVLVFAVSQKLYWAGILSVLFMALGTGITVSALATLAVKAKDIAIRVSNGESAVPLRAIRALEIVAACGIMLFGVMMLGGAIASA